MFELKTEFKRVLNDAYMQGMYDMYDLITVAQKYYSAEVIISEIIPKIVISTENGLKKLERRKKRC